jgi:hypothetical protein
MAALNALTARRCATRAESSGMTLLQTRHWQRSVLVTPLS